MTDRPHGKIVLLTGASGGIGKATARALLRRGYTVYAAAPDPERLGDLEEAGAVALRMDVTEEDDLHAAVERIDAERDGVDVLINNAGYGVFGAIEDTPLDEARRQFEVNLFGPARLTQLVLPSMRARGAGTIVNVSSVGGRAYTPLGAWYYASKHAVEGWSDCLRIEVAPFGIDVVVVQPGVVATEFQELAVGPMLERSGGTAYAELARKAAQQFGWSQSGAASPPSVIADLIVRAIEADRPRTRYAGGRLARLLPGIRKWFGDRAYDRVILGR